MKKPQKSSLLEEKIAISGIHQAIEALEKEFSKYERSAYVTEQRYHLKRKTGETCKLLRELKSQLASLEESSKDWEAPE